MILDRGCYERGCACYDERDGDGVEVHVTDLMINGLTEEETMQSMSVRGLSDPATTKRRHACPDWDFLEIDEDDPEFECCLCYSETPKENT